MACYQLIDPGSEWRLHRHWHYHSTMGDLPGRPAEVVGGHFADINEGRTFGLELQFNF